jgi:glutamate dehydrogenase/leucine dehydrogenase
VLDWSAKAANAGGRCDHGLEMEPKLMKTFLVVEEVDVKLQEIMRNIYINQLKRLRIMAAR